MEEKDSEEDDHSFVTHYVLKNGCPECHDDIEIIVTLNLGIEIEHSTTSLSATIGANHQIDAVVHCPSCMLHKAFWGDNAVDEATTYLRSY